MKFVLLSALLLSISACLSQSDNRVADVATKTISYRGGIVEFSIPSHWIEEYDENGGGTFYEAGSIDGPLRLNVLSFSASGSQRADLEATARAQAEKHNGEVTVLPSSDVMARYDLESSERGQPITLRFWAIYDRVNDSDVRIAVFSYTLPTSRFKDTDSVWKLDMLDREIRNAKFANTPGVSR